MFEFKLPDLGEGVHEGQIVSVLVKQGEPIKEYQPMLEVETDKAAVEIPSPKAGVVSRVMVQPGQTVHVGDVMIVIDEAGAAAAGAPTAAKAPARAAEVPARAGAFGPAPGRGAATVAPAARPPAAAPTAPAAPAPPRFEPAPASAAARAPAASQREPAAGMAPAARAPATAVVAPPRHDGPVPAAPVVRKLARELGIDINQVSASGPGGRVLREDVERFALHLRGGAAEAPGAAAAIGVPMPSEALPDFSQYGPVRREKASQIRKTIARQMTRAWLNVPRVTHGDTADITELERNRKAFNKHLREGEARLSVTAIIMKVVAAALRRYPMLNCSYDAQNEEVIYKDYVHLGVAVDTPRGLVVPVVRNVDQKPLPQIAAELHDIAGRTRQAKFEIADLRGGTFTITNVGALGGTFVTPMVNFPEVGILGLGRAQWQPKVLEDMSIAPRLILPLSLSFDHRICDGADAARFTRDVVEALENPLRLLSL